MIPPNQQVQNAPMIPANMLNVTISGIVDTIAAILGIALNAILPGKDYQFNDEVPNPSKPSKPLTVTGGDENE